MSDLIKSKEEISADINTFIDYFLLYYSHATREKALAALATRLIELPELPFRGDVADREAVMRFYISMYEEECDE